MSRYKCYPLQHQHLSQKCKEFVSWGNRYPDARVPMNRVRAFENVVQLGCWFPNDLTWGKMTSILVS